MPTPAALAAAAACFCSSPAFQRAQVTYLLARLAGGSTDPKVLSYAARCWICVSERMLLADQAYLLSVLAGGSRVPSVVASQSACYCFPWDVMWNVRVQALAAAAGITNPNTLANGSVQFMAAGYPQAAVQAYLLAVLAGVSIDPAAIGAAAIQFSGLNEEALHQVWTALAVSAASFFFNSGVVILSDGAGGFWQLIVDTQGNLGTQSVTGPVTSNIVLSDGSVGFWQIVVDAAGDRGAQSVAGPATTAPILSDGFGGRWQVIVDTSGNLGTQSV